MIKLYPPYIEGSIPAFYGKELAVPYTMNKTVGYKDISGFKLKIITVSTNRTISIIDDSGYNIETNEAYFNMPTENMVIGQFYKIQLAYKDNLGAIGFYSTIGVVKYCAESKVSIAGLEAGNINLHQYDYVGYYEPTSQDPTEVEIYYQFDVYDCNDKLYASSGKKIHNATIEGGDLYHLADSFEEQQIYFIKYTVWTLNGLKVSTRKYRLMERQSLDIEIEAELKADLNYNEGYVQISLFDTAQKEQIIEGAFLITRTDSLSEYKQWNELYRFELRNQKLKSFSFKDFTIQQGVEYQYSIQQYNDNGLYSNRLLSNVVKADFEDSFLYDGERQLKIRFNPKMTSFKNTVLEQKVNTIGNKYPFIFRNGNVSYKEFPIGGLISRLSDEEGLFIKDYHIEKHRHTTLAENDVLNYFSTDLVSDNLTKERLFKLEALEWLTNGEPKLFRSPTEGNYIVRLLNTSMTPEQALGRMLHNFTATAYEVAELNYNNLVFYKFINSDGIDKSQMKWETVELATINNGIVEYRTGQLNRSPAVTVEFTGMMPGNKIWLDDEEIQIGVNGSYYVSLNNPIKSIRVPEGAQYIGFMTYSFYGESVSKFNEIYNIELNENPGWRIENTVSGGWLDVLASIEDAKTEIVQFYYLRFRKADHLTPKLNDEENNIYPILNNDLISENKEYLIKINEEEISIKEIETYEIEDFNRPELLWIGPDVICEAGFQTKVIDYNIENSNTELKNLKISWLNTLENYENLLETYSGEMKKLEDQLIYHLMMQKTNKRVEELSIQEKENLIAEIKQLKLEPYYKLLTFEETQDYTNYKEDNTVMRDPWEKILEEVKIEVELAIREGDEELKDYWLARQNELETIINKYLPEDVEYSCEDWQSAKAITTSLYHQDGKYNYQPKDKVYQNNIIIAQPGIEVNVAEKGWEEKGESFSLAQAYYLPEPEGDEKAIPKGELREGSLWIDTLVNYSADRITPFYNYENFDYDENGRVESEEEIKTVKIDVDTYIGPSDPYSMEIYVDLWIDNSDIANSFEDSLQKKVDMFYYNGESYKDIAYLDPEAYALAKMAFNKQYAEDEKNINQEINTVNFEIAEVQSKVIIAENAVYDKKVEIAIFNQSVSDLEKAVEDAKYNYEKIEDSAVDKTEAKEAWEAAQKALDDYLASESYNSKKTELEEQLTELQLVLNDANKELAQKQSNLSEAEEKLAWLEGSKDFLFNMSEEFYTKNGINTPEDYNDGGWRSATMKHRIYDNDEYNKIYNDYEELILQKREEVYTKAPFLKEQDELFIENCYYTNQELTLEERENVEDTIMEAISENQVDGKYIESFNYEQKLELDEIWKQILNYQIERDEELKDIPISIMDFSEPERYILLFSRSHYIENLNTKRPADVFGKGYCMYQFYDRQTAGYRVKQLEISIDSYIEKHGIKESEVEDWLIRNDINERDELLAYLKYLENFYPTDALSAPGYNIFRPITLNEIKDGKLYIEEELELVYKQLLENAGKSFKRLTLGYNIPDFYYKTGNYTRMKECQDRIGELDKVLKNIIEWRDSNPEKQIEDLYVKIKNYGDSLEKNRQIVNATYNNYIVKLSKALKEEEDK